MEPPTLVGVAHLRTVREHPRTARTVRETVREAPPGGGEGGLPREGGRGIDKPGFGAAGPITYERAGALLGGRFRCSIGRPASTAAGWGGGAWLEWECPRNVVRESHYQAAFVKLCGPVCGEGYLVPVEVRLRRDPGNAYDPNAVGAFVAGEHVGHLRAEVAAQVAEGCDRAAISEWAVAGLIRGGSTRADYFGVHLWMSRLTEPGPLVEFAPDLWEVPWPPGKHEDNCHRQLGRER